MDAKAAVTALSPILIPQLADPQKSRMAFVAVRLLGDAAGSLVPQVIPVLLNADHRIARDAAEALGRIGAGREDVMIVLLKRMQRVGATPETDLAVVGACAALRDLAGRGGIPIAPNIIFPLVRVGDPKGDVFHKCEEHILMACVRMLVASRQGNAGVTLLANHLERTIRRNASAELTMTFGIYNELRDNPAIVEALEPLAEQAKADVSDVTDLAGDDDSAKTALQKTVDESNEFDSPSLYAARILAGILLIPYPKKEMSANGDR